MFLLLFAMIPCVRLCVDCVFAATVMMSSECRWPFIYAGFQFIVYFTSAISDVMISEAEFIDKQYSVDRIFQQDNIEVRVYIIRLGQCELMSFHFIFFFEILQFKKVIPTKPDPLPKNTGQHRQEQKSAQNFFLVSMAHLLNTIKQLNIRNTFHYNRSMAAPCCLLGQWKHIEPLLIPIDERHAANFATRLCVEKFQTFTFFLRCGRIFGGPCAVID